MTSFYSSLRDVGVNSLLQQLVSHQLDDERKAYFVQPRYSKDRVKLVLKRKAYNALFSILKGPHRHVENDKSNSSLQTEANDILSRAFHLRCGRKFDSANKLEVLLQDLLSNNNYESEVKPILKFLLCLADSDKTEVKHSIGHEQQNVPIVSTKQETCHTYPVGPMNYGDTNNKQVLESQSMYMHYPRELFENANAADESLGTSSIFELTPGSSLCGRGLFNVQGHLNEKHEKELQYSLFGALVQSKVTSLDVKLDLPELSDSPTCNSYEVKIPKSASSTSQFLEDEGFIDTTIASSCSSGTVEDSAFEDDIWEKALHYVPSRHRAWEIIGCIPGKTAKPYFTEAGHEALDEWYYMKIHDVSLLSALPVPPVRIITHSQFVKDLLNLMNGVPSNTFCRTQETTFAVTEGTSVSGMTPEAFLSLSKNFIECGTSYCALSQFSQAPVMDSFYNKGVIYRSFLGAIRRFLQHYRAKILSIPSDKTAIELTVICHKVFSQMRYLSALCKCNRKDGEENNTFPVGIKLMTYLYNETVEAFNTESYPMMLSLLQTTSAPYFIFLQNWIFHGFFCDIYGEFMIKVNEDCLAFRDKHYWTSGYALDSEKMEDSVPLFLSDLAETVFTCGKSLNLMKLCCQQHFICNVGDREFPRLQIIFSESEINSLSAQCDVYAGRMQQLARRTRLSRQEKRENEERHKQEIVQEARRMAEQNIKEIEARIEEVRKKVDAKKRKEFQRLKSQMEEDQQRRAMASEASKKADVDIMNRLTKREETMDDEELRLEAEARKELIEYYSQLSAAAALKERKALWRVRRGRLDLKRNNFLLTETSVWEAEMKQTNIDGKQASENTIQDISNLIKSSHTEEASTDIENQDSAELGQTPDEELINFKSLPEWAKNQLEHGKLTIVSDEDLNENKASSVSVDSEHENQLAVCLADVAENESQPENSQEDITDQSCGQQTSSSLRKRRPSVKLSDSQSATAETTSRPAKPAVSILDGDMITKESEPDIVKPKIKVYSDVGACQETEEEERKQHIKMVENIHASKESEQSDERKMVIKMNENVHASTESEKTDEMHLHKKKQVEDFHFSKESQAAEWKIKKQSVFGHVSEISNSYADFQAPKLKRHTDMHVSRETNLRDFGIKPRIKFNPKMSAAQESVSEVKPQLPQIKTFKGAHANIESEFIDFDEINLQKFRQQNVHGHSSDSTVQKLLYGAEFGTKKLPEIIDRHEVSVEEKSMKEEQIWHQSEVEEYQDQFDFLGNPPVVDLMSGLSDKLYGGYGDFGISTNDDIEVYKFITLPSLINRSVKQPLLIQAQLVNECIVNYFEAELDVRSHFISLHRYLMMGDGDFAQILSDLLLDKLSKNPRPHEILNPVFLNSILTKAQQCSVHVGDKHSENLSFSLKSLPAQFNFYAHNILDCLELRYKVEWPLNIVITESCMAKYSKIFSFLLQMKRIVWVLKDVWHRMKGDALIRKAGNSPQFRQLQLHRQEMQHFVKVMQGYISNQLIHATWLEFQESLDQEVHSLDDLHKVHSEYLNKALFRCLLTKKAAPVMKIIQDIFCLILKFRGELFQKPWHTDEATKEIIHPNFPNMVKSYRVFREYSVFLFKVVNKLCIRGYQPHLSELLLRLNFNNYYKDE